MKATMTSAAALAALFGAQQSLALGFGEAELSSGLSSPLRVSIPLLGLTASGLDSDALRVDVPSLWDHQAMGYSEPVVPRDLQVTLVPDGRGGVMARMTTSGAVREPVLRFVLRAQWPGGSALREYQFIIDPPVMPRRPVPAVPVSSMTLAAKATAQPRIAPARAGTTYGPVTPGDTLYAIAAAAYPDQAANMPRVMAAIVARNPAAFTNGDANRLQTGASLMLPETVDLVATTAPAAGVGEASMTAYTVAAGDTLYAIARRVLGIEQSGLGGAVARLYENNPGAFIDGDRDRLRVGATLRLDGAASGSAALPAVNATTVATTAATPAGSVPAASVETAATVTGATATGLGDLVTQIAAVEETLATEQATGMELSARLDALTQELETLRERDAELTAKTEKLTADLAAATPVVVSAQQVQRPAASSDAPSVARPAASRRSEAPSGAANEPARELDSQLTASLTASASGPLLWVGMGVLILVLLGGALFMRRRARATREPRLYADEEAPIRKLADVHDLRAPTDGFEVEELELADASQPADGMEADNVHMTDAARAGSLAREAAVHLAYADYSAAKTTIVEAIHLDPHRDEHKMVLVTVYENMGEHAKARQIVDDLLTRREQLPQELRQQVEELRQQAGD